MATTTNYGWTTPDDTALVKDGAAAIRTLGTAIDTTVFNNASAGIAKTIVDAKGDLIAATAADTVARLAVGANDTVLTADSSAATGLKWATPASGGGMTLISTTTLTGASVTLSSIPSTYNDLVLVLQNVVTATGGDVLRLRVNSDSNTRYRTTQYLDTPQTNVAPNNSSWVLISGTRDSDGQNLIHIEIPNYANTTTWKTAESYAVTNHTTTSTNMNMLGYVYGFNQTGAISSLTIFGEIGNLTSGTALLYGVK